MLFTIRPLLIILLLSTLCNSCNGGEMAEKTIKFPSIKDVPASAWEKLAQKKIYFGHQSVGYNIITGINEIMGENPQIKLNIVKTSDAKDFDVAIFAHDWIGENMNPQSKTEAFENILSNGVGKKIDIAFMKFCYVDVTARTDIENVFEDYKKKLFRLTKKFPNTTFVHLAVPLTSKPSGSQAPKQKVKNIIKKIIGKPVFDHHDNINRHRLNEMLRSEYYGQNSFFDLAEVEAYCTDGTASTFTKDDKIYLAMAPEYTYDGGHLNKEGSRKAAEQLLILLSNL